MTTVQPEGEDLRRAVKWISECLQDEPGAAVRPLIEQASIRFNLSPREENYLTDFYRKRK